MLFGGRWKYRSNELWKSYSDIRFCWHQQQQTWSTIFFTNAINSEKSFQGILVTDVSDHPPIFRVDFDKTDCAKEYFIYRRNMSQRNKLVFRDDLANLDWNEMYQLSDTQAAFGWFHSKLLLLYYKHFPTQKVKLKYNARKMWLKQGINDAIKRKINCIRNIWISFRLLMKWNIKLLEIS